MDALKNLLDNEKGLVGVGLIIAATVLAGLKILTPQEWKDYTVLIFGIYAGTTALHGGLVAIGTKSSLLTPPPSAPSKPAEPPK